jgi:hypothetical protein
MLRLESRVKRLEAALNQGSDRDRSGCHHGFYVIWPDGSALGSQPCDVCGRQRIIMRVVYDSDSRNQSQN